MLSKNPRARSAWSQAKVQGRQVYAPPLHPGGGIAALQDNFAAPIKGDLKRVMLEGDMIPGAAQNIGINAFVQRDQELLNIGAITWMRQTMRKHGLLHGRKRCAISFTRVHGAVITRNQFRIRWTSALRLPRLRLLHRKRRGVANVRIGSRL